MRVERRDFVLDGAVGGVKSGKLIVTEASGGGFFGVSSTYNAHV